MMQGYRTMIFSVLLALLGVIEASSGTVRAVIEPMMGENWAGLVLLLISASVAALRAVTTTPPWTKG